ncbi:hypothetical protein FHS29_007248 [Saccharothrix tamanrassetensis]|uniref:Uncharacterized protein n=1 Tax=Saccharothrix tamanrassetensis TaxID=1051531 RepID=A0A841CTJ7_9PSEU|nr:hypothetical protein [Saccharothrix tamanrassetensis]MBB5960620.1 hypothetical protein [Saccharothrix tamanrassetensis]
MVDDGRLLLAEPHDLPLIALCSGAPDDFWTFHDTDLRPSSPLLSARQWTTLLLGSDFSTATRLGGEEDDPDPAFSVTVARRKPRPASAPSLPTGTKPFHWVVVAEDPDDPVVAPLTRRLDQAGSVRTTSLSDQTGHWSAVLPTGPTAATAVRLVVLLDSSHVGSAGHRSIVDQAVHRTAALSAIVTAYRGTNATDQAALWLVTRPCGALPDAATHVADAAPWGAARSLANEHPEITVRRLSLDRSHDSDADAHRLAWELLSPTDDDEIVLTRNGRFTARVLDHPARVTRPAQRDAYLLAVRNTGLDHRGDDDLAQVP